MSEKQRKILLGFNEKVRHLESLRFYKRYANVLPQVVAHVRNVKWGEFENGVGTFDAHFVSEVPDLDREEVDAFVLTYRMLTQNNDRFSIGNLAQIYDSDWIPEDAAHNFRESRRLLNDHLDGTYSTANLGEPIPTRTILEVFLYGALAHSNPAHEQTFLAWTADGGMTGLFWAEFIAALKVMMRFFQHVRDLNAAVLDHTAGAP
jgi:hypothetical protein